MVGHVRSIVAVTALGAGTAVVAGGTAFGLRTVAGEAEDTGPGQMVASLLSGAAFSGGILGMGAGYAARLVPDARQPLRGWRGLAMLPVGIAGAAVGGQLANSGIAARHPAEYARARSVIHDANVATQRMFRTAGADEAVLGDRSADYDRSHSGARYRPYLPPPDGDIRIGRAPGGAAFIDADVFAHEYAHSVVQEYAPLLLFSRGGDARAIHESLADTFAMAVDTDDWLIGEDTVEGGMRSISHPEQLGARIGEEVIAAPIHRDQLGTGLDEHLANGIGNKVAATIGMELGRAAMAEIYLGAVRDGDLGFNATYADLAAAVRDATIEIHGAGSDAAQVVDAAWSSAGYPAAS